MSDSENRLSDTRVLTANQFSWVGCKVIDQKLRKGFDGLEEDTSRVEVHREYRSSSRVKDRGS